MNKEIEFESRTMLTKKQYDRLKGIYLDETCSYFVQENKYFDNEDCLLLKNHIVLRIRTIDSSSILQMKIKGNNGDEEYHSLDFKIENNILILPDDIKNIISNKIGKDISVHYLCSLITKRIEKRIDDYLLVIDENTYSNITDYNLEIEANSKESANEIMEKYCKKYNLELTKNYISKSRRVISLLMK